MSSRSGDGSERPWHRAESGTYRSSDGRFEIGSDGPGRWYVRDAAEHDELGLERTIGPFATLATAKADAEARRGRAPEASPLSARLKGRTPRMGHGRGRPSAAPPPRPPTWLDRLERSRPADAKLARRRIEALERSGITDAEAIVRRDIETDEPAIAEALLARSLELAIRAAIGPDSIEPALPDAGSTGDHAADPGAVRRLVTFVAQEVLAAALDTLTVQGRPQGAASSLPGWRLVEHDPEHRDSARPIRLAATDAALERREG